jgi:hypothetical protein
MGLTGWPFPGDLDLFGEMPENARQSGMIELGRKTTKRAERATPGAMAARRVFRGAADAWA